jgi:hypothetical protein
LHVGMLTNWHFPISGVQKMLRYSNITATVSFNGTDLLVTVLKEDSAISSIVNKTEKLFNKF